MSYSKKILIALVCTLILHLALLKVFHSIAKKRSELIIRQAAYFKLVEKPDVLFVGDSRARVGFDESQYKKSFSLASYGEGYQRNYYRLRNIFNSESEHSRIIVMQLEDLRFTKGFYNYKTGNYFYNKLYASSEIPLTGMSFLQEFCNYYYLKIFPYNELITIIKQNELEFNKKINRKFSGLSPQERIAVTQKYLNRELEGDYKLQNLYYAPAISFLHKTISLCRENNTKIIFVKYPLTNEILTEIEARLGKEALKNPVTDSIVMAEGFPLIDLERTFADHPDYFIDCHHLNGAGRAAFTPLLINKLDSVITRNNYLK
jgi:hypothetical protein